MARRLFPRVVPAIASGTWRAAGQQFRVPVRRPMALPVESFTRVRRAQIMANGINGGIISGSGSATVSVGPQGYGTRWYPNQVAIATQSGAADASTATGYLNVIGPGGFLFQSYAGGGDQPGIAVPEMQPGDLIYVVWSGGHAGDWCQVQVIGPMDVLVPLPEGLGVRYTDAMVTIDEQLERKRLAYIQLAEYSKWASRRDEIIESAASAGISPKAIGTIVRLSRGHVYEIIKGVRSAKA